MEPSHLGQLLSSTRKRGWNQEKRWGYKKLRHPTILDRIAQEVVRAHLDAILEPKFHNSSYGYRKRAQLPPAVEKATQNALLNNWAIAWISKAFSTTLTTT
jgi:retron-type reverse transcriptase